MVWIMREADKVLNRAVLNEAVVEHWKERAADRRSIFFCATVDHAEAVAAAFRADGVTAETVTGEMPGRVATLRAKQMKFNIYEDLVPVSLISSTPLVLSLHPSVPAKSVKQLVALAKRTSTPLNAGGNTSGSTAHLTAEMFNQAVGIKSTVVTYRGGGPAVIALISGEIDYIFATAPSIMPHLKSGRAKALAVTTPKRSSALPDLPTMNSIYPGFESWNWYAMFYPKGTPQPIIDKMNSEIRKALESSEVKDFYPKQALDAVGSSPEELSKLLRSEIAKYAKVIKAAGIRTN